MARGGASKSGELERQPRAGSGRPLRAAERMRSEGREAVRVPVTAATLSEVALAYLNRVDPSRQQLRKKLQEFARKRGESIEPDRLLALIEAILKRYEVSGLIDEQRLADSSLVRLRARGASSRAIQQRLNLRGLRAEVVDRAFSEERHATREPDLEAARALVRRRKLGCFRPAAERAEKRRRDLAVLARAGFDFDTAQRALGGGRDDEL